MTSANDDMHGRREQPVIEDEDSDLWQGLLAMAVVAAVLFVVAALVIVVNQPQDTSPGRAPRDSAASCSFLRASLAHFEPPNLPPNTAMESAEYGSIQAQMAKEGCS